MIFTLGGTDSLPSIMRIRPGPVRMSHTMATGPQVRAGQVISVKAMKMKLGLLEEPGKMVLISSGLRAVMM